MAAGSDIIPTNDSVTVVQAPEHAMNNAGAAMSNTDSLASFHAMKATDKAPSSLPDVSITDDSKPAAGSAQPSDTASQHKEDGTEPIPKLFTDLTTNDPKQAETAASNFINAIFQGASPETFAALKKEFHQANGNVEKEEEAVGMITPASPAVMHAIGAILDKK